MKKTLLVIAPIVLGLATLSVQSFAQVATQKTEKPIWMEPIGSKIESDSTVIFDFGLSSRFNSSYVSPFDKLVTEHPVIQSDIVVGVKIKDVPGKFYAIPWRSTDFDGEPTPGDEADYTLGWKNELFQGIGLNLWITYLDFSPMGHSKGDQIRFFAEIDRKFVWKTKSLFDSKETTSSVTPFVRFEVPRGIGGYNDPGGLRIYPGLKHNWEFASSCSVFQKINLVFDDGACGLQPGKFIDYKVGLSWQVTKWLTIEPISYREIRPITDVTDGRKTNRIIGTGFSMGF